MTTIDRRRMLILGFLGAGAGVAGGCDRRAAPATGADPALWSGFDERITERTLAEAEKLLGLQLTEAERRQLLGGGPVAGAENVFGERLAAIEERRATVEFSHDLAPALHFDPRLPNVPYPRQAYTLSLYPDRMSDAPESDADAAHASIKQQIHWLATGALTSVDLTRIYLERIEALNPTLEAFITVTRDLALEQAEAADRERSEGRVRGPLHGIPYAAKDLFDTAGIPTTWGAEPFRDRVPASDARVVEKLRGAGAVLLGKTAVGALAWGDVWFGGQTRNPWNPMEGSSGSSAGSASATAAGLCAFALGTETLGSIVSPVHRTGITGLRPSFGRVSRTGVMALCWSLDKVGSLCRRAEDNAIVLNTINGEDVNDSGSLGVGVDYNGRDTVEDMTVAYDPAWFEDARTADLEALDALDRIGVRRVELRAPELPTEPLIALLEAEAAAAFEALTLGGQDDALRRQVDRAWPNVLRGARFISAVDYLQADRLRRLAMRQLHAFFDPVDAVIGPSFGNPMLTLTNFTGHPCLVLRAGFETRAPVPLFEQAGDASERRSPRSISLWGGLFRDTDLIRIGRALEAELGVHQERPPL